ncbi:MAG: hypothetical protein NT085_01785 [candidate division SR1 bacterium]|nr:hypothetical protein [candidate division SR1 bacterium]
MEELKQTSSEQEKNTLQTKIQELNAKIKFFQKVEQSDDKADVFTKTGGASFSLHDMAMDYRRTSCEFAFTSSLEWTFAKHIMLENEDDLKRGAVGGTMELYMDINGIGGYVSDTFYNNTAQVIKFAGEIALSCITFGAALSITASIQVLQKATWYWRLANLAAKALIFTLADVSIRSTLKGDFSERGSDFVKDIGKNIAVFAVLGRVKKLFELPKMLHLLKSIEIEERVVASRAHVILENITAAMGVGTIQVASDVISGKDIDAKEFLKIVGEIIAIGLIFNASKIRYGSKHIVIEGKVFETSEVNKYLHEINGIDHKIMQEGLTKQELQFQKERVSQTLKKAILEGRDIGEINFLTLVEKQLTTRLNPKATVVGKANVLLLGKSRVANLEHDLVKKEFGLIFEQLTGAFLPTSLAALGTALELSIAKLGNSITTEGLNNVTTTEGGNSEITTEGGNSGIIEKVQSLITELSEKIKTSEMTADSKLLALNDVEKIKEYVQTYE